ncbi:hypothetical protein KC360_g6219 [Hortaea werneckii]|nr:hypothetical protein KC361_g6377 [Hortaea werneckii]KAI6881972.1 hypothetical protein KC325_g6137 [Hortaea werneckii]KAI6990395.1 hypothetical protein KC359_g6692 [Hortaea werneckii]KAI7143647.1 hypothetical protein KC344_g6100 [Hortaea werneckii]KAI7171267.1 hypothetical protein KC360_g6219 [Hortaea werneckii]
MVFNVQKPQDVEGAIIEAWAQGYMIGSLIIMACIAFSNMRRGVLLHKIIVIELVFGMFHGTFIFTKPGVYNWYLSATAIFLNISWSLHNYIAWIKNKPLLPRWGSIFYITTLSLVQPYWVLEIVANFLYFSDTSDLFKHTRPYEALFRDPWWLFTIANLIYNIKSKYEFGLIELIRVSPRFGVLLGAMFLSIAFIIIDILAVTHVISATSLPDGINPFWKLAFVFKCLTDTIVLDDFKSALDRLKNYKLEQMGSILSDGLRGEFTAVEQARRKKDEDRGMALSTFPDINTRDWTKNNNCDHIDLEAALRMDDKQRGESSGSSGG